MKQTITLRQFLKQAPREINQFNKPEWFDNFKGLSYTEKYNLYINQTPMIEHFLKSDDEHLYYKKTCHQIYRIGKTFFIKKIQVGSVYITPKSVKINLPSQETFAEFLQLLNIKLWKDTRECLVYPEYQLLSKPSILKDILTGHVYNDETLWKRFALHAFKLKNVSWKDFKTCYKNFNIPDIVHFTKNVDNSLRIIAAEYKIDPWGPRMITIRDTLNLAVKFDQIIDLNWSNKRLEQFHQEQIRLANALEIASKPQIPIFDQLIGNEHITMLNNEREIYEEGLNMHHCIHSCYFNRIKRQEYAAFHMTFPEDCTFGVKILDGQPFLDQIYLKYDKPVQRETSRIAEKFIEKHNEQLLQLLKSPIPVHEATIDLRFNTGGIDRSFETATAFNYELP
jgi:hypothetical protein